MKVARERKGWNRTELEQACKPKLSQGMVSRLERGERAGMGDTMAKIATALQVRADWLLTGTGPMDAEAEGAPDPIPNRAEAARLARDDGVYGLAIEAVLAEKPEPNAPSRSVLWWADRMRMRQAELLAGTRGTAPVEPSGIRPAAQRKK